MSDGPRIWLAPGTKAGHLIVCAWCSEYIHIGSVYFWRPDGGRSEGQDDIPLHPPCAALYREAWWRGKRHAKASEVLEDYGKKSRDVWEQWEIDTKAYRWGLEERKKIFGGATPVVPIVGEK